MEANKKISFYYLKMKDGKFRLMRKTEQPAVIYDIVGETDDEETIKRHVERLNNAEHK